MQTIAHDNSFAHTVGPTAAAPSTRALWTGRVLSGLAVAFLIFDSVGKLLRVQPVMEGTRRAGVPCRASCSRSESRCSPVFSSIWFRGPRCSARVLLTGYLGGAVATHVRVGSPLFSHVLFPTYVAVLLWGGLLLRDRRLRAFLPLRRPE